jgi:hypothetical protein
VPDESTDTTKIDLAISQIQDRIVSVTAQDSPTVRDGDTVYELNEYLKILTDSLEKLRHERDAIAGGSKRSAAWLGTPYSEMDLY